MENSPEGMVIYTVVPRDNVQVIHTVAPIVAPTIAPQVTKPVLPSRIDCTWANKDQKEYWAKYQESVDLLHGESIAIETVLLDVLANGLNDSRRQALVESVNAARRVAESMIRTPVPHGMEDIGGLIKHFVVANVETMSGSWELLDTESQAEFDRIDQQVKAYGEMAIELAREINELKGRFCGSLRS